MTLFSVAQPVAFDVPRAGRVRSLFALTVIALSLHERDWWSTGIVSRATVKLEVRCRFDD